MHDSTLGATPSGTLDWQLDSPSEAGSQVIELVTPWNGSDAMASDEGGVPGGGGSGAGTISADPSDGVQKVVILDDDADVAAQEESVA